MVMWNQNVLHAEYSEVSLRQTGLGFEDSITVSKTHSTNFVSSSKPSMSEIIKPVEVTPLRKIRVDLK